MLYILLAPLSILFVAQTASTSPLAASDSTAAASLPITDLPLVAADVTLSPALHARGTVHSVLVTCTAPGCTGTCTYTGLPTMFDTCLGAPAFASLAVTQQFGESLGYNVFVGPPGCATFYQVPAINTCYNVNGGPFKQFALTT